MQPQTSFYVTKKPRDFRKGERKVQKCQLISGLEDYFSNSTAMACCYSG